MNRPPDGRDEDEAPRRAPTKRGNALWLLVLLLIGYVAWTAYTFVQPGGLFHEVGKVGKSKP